LDLAPPRRISNIFVSLDAHHRVHIAHGAFWLGADGNPPPPFAQIAHADVVTGTWKSRDPKLRDWALEYTKSLEEGGRFTHIIWPSRSGWQALSQPTHGERAAIGPRASRAGAPHVAVAFRGTCFDVLMPSRYHCLLGTPGQAISPALLPALDKWSKQSGRAVTFVLKGQSERGQKKKGRLRLGRATALTLTLASSEPPTTR